MFEPLKKHKVSLLIIALLMCSNGYFFFNQIKYESLYKWHHLKYHEFRMLFEYTQKYPRGTSIKHVIKTEENYQKNHAWCENDAKKLCVEPKMSDWDYSHYCGYTFTFENNKLIDIVRNSPCH